MWSPGAELNKTKQINHAQNAVTERRFGLMLNCSRWVLQHWFLYSLKHLSDTKNNPNSLLLSNVCYKLHGQAVLENNFSFFWKKKPFILDLD